MSDASLRLRERRVPQVEFIRDMWHWSVGICYLLDVDDGAARKYAGDLWRAIAREHGESWASRRDEAMRAVRMKASRQKQPLVRTTLYVTLPTRRGGLLEQAVHVVAVADSAEEGVFHVWLTEEDRISSGGSPMSIVPGSTGS